MSRTRSRKPLYRGGRRTRRRELRQFDAEYGDRGPYVYGATVGKVGRERAAKRGGRMRERVRGHWSTSSRGHRYHVKSHWATVHSVPHSRGHHSGRCGSACRRGQVPHRHARTRRRR